MAFPLSLGIRRNSDDWGKYEGPPTPSSSDEEGLYNSPPLELEVGKEYNADTFWERYQSVVPIQGALVKFTWPPDGIQYVVLSHTKDHPIWEINSVHVYGLDAHRDFRKLLSSYGEGNLTTQFKTHEFTIGDDISCNEGSTRKMVCLAKNYFEYRKEQEAPLTEYLTKYFLGDSCSLIMPIIHDYL